MKLQRFNVGPDPHQMSPADNGRWVRVADLRKALERELGRPLAKQVLDSMLAGGER